MAYLKIFPIKVTDKKALDYITNPDKTDEKLLVSSFGCSPETADLEFSMTREMAKKNGMDKGDNLAFHLIQSFKPGEVDAETAHRLGQQFANEVLKGKYEYVISTHVDKNHIHNHIIFNVSRKAWTVGRGEQELVLWGGNANNGANCGLAYANSNNDWSNSNANIGSRHTYLS